MNEKLLVMLVLNILDVTQYGLQKITGIHRSTIANWVKGINKPEIGSIFQLMYFFEKKTNDKELTKKLFANFIKVGLNKDN